MDDLTIQNITIVNADTVKQRKMISNESSLLMPKDDVLITLKKGQGLKKTVQVKWPYKSLILLY